MSIPGSKNPLLNDPAVSQLMTRVMKQLHSFVLIILARSRGTRELAPAALSGLTGYGVSLCYLHLQEAETLTRVGAAVSLAMQIQIQKADALLKKILQSGDIKVGEELAQSGAHTISCLKQVVFPC